MQTQTRAHTHALTNSPCTSRGTTQNPFPAGSFPALCCQWLLRQQCSHTCMHREDHTYCMHAHTYTHTHSTHVHASNHYITSHRVNVCSLSSRLTFHCKCPPLQWKASSSQSPVNLGRNNEGGAESRDPKISNDTTRHIQWLCCCCVATDTPPGGACTRHSQLTWKNIEPDCAWNCFKFHSVTFEAEPESKLQGRGVHK